MTSGNRLRDETSPYLRQHALNPVDWLPWGEAAFAEARRRDVPLFVSIGYSACHWCHVMAHESFEDEALAAKLNAAFVAVKVDREERPDVDSVYMDAVQALTGSGGWPLSAFCTPDGRPFFGGTYFPPRPRGGMPGFGDVLDAVSSAWAANRDELLAQASDLTEAVAGRIAAAPAPAALAPGRRLLEEALARVSAVYDARNGGMGRAPKFPNAPTFELVARAAAPGGPRREQALAMLVHTLEQMAAGGIYDQLAGGFCRYSVDASWQVPHFEKMLYDQAMLAPLYLHGFQLSGDERFAQVMSETLDYVCTQLRSPSGGFFSSEDADAAGVEGSHATWTPAELEAVLGPVRARKAAAFYGVSDAGNFEHGRSVLHVSADRIVRDAEVEQMRAELAAARRGRVQPGIDDKVLTEWNAMTISALAEAAGATGEARWLEAARSCAELLLGSLRRDDGRWLRSLHGGRAAHLAVAADYAWLVDCFTRLSEASGGTRWLGEAVGVADAMLELFSAADGGWYSTGSDAEPLVVRPRDSYDGVTPSAGSVAASALARLGALSGEQRFVERAAASVAAGGELLARAPSAFPRLVEAALLLDPGPLEIVVTGDRPDLVALAQRRYLPDAVLAWGERNDGPLFEGRPPGYAFVCRAGACLAPARTGDALLEAIELAGSAR